MYEKVLIPLDGTKEAEQVYDKIEQDLSPDAEVVLLHVIQPSRSISLSGSFAGLQLVTSQRLGFNPDRHHQMPGESRSTLPAFASGDPSPQISSTQLEEIWRTQVLTYLSDVADRLNGDSRSFKLEAPVSDSIAEAIEKVAAQEGVDLVAMYTRDRRGLAKWIHQSVSGNVRSEAPIEVKTFKPYELGEAPVTLMVERQANPGSEDELRTLLRELRAGATKQRGFLSGETKVDAYDPTTFLTISSWSTRDAFDEWETNPERDQIISEIDNLIIDTPTRRVWVGDEVQLTPAN